MIHQAPGGPAAHWVSLDLVDARRRLGLSPKSLVQTGRNFESPFQAVQFRPRSKPDWLDYWRPWHSYNLSGCASVDLVNCAGNAVFSTLRLLVFAVPQRDDT
jgi:hypothetical protein